VLVGFLLPVDVSVYASAPTPVPIPSPDDATPIAAQSSMATIMTAIATPIAVPILTAFDAVTTTSSVSAAPPSHAIKLSAPTTPPALDTVMVTPSGATAQTPNPLAVDDRPMVNGQPGMPRGITTWQPKTLSPEQIATYLGWVEKQLPNQVCSGYFVEPNLYYPSPYPVKSHKGPVHISANESAFSEVGTSVLTGSVQVNQPNQQINAEKAYLNRDPKTQKINSIDVYGQVIVRQPGSMAMGDAGHYDLIDKSLHLNHVLYRTSFGQLNTPNQSNPGTLGEPVNISNLNGWGVADQMNRDSQGIIHVLKGTYTACPPKTSVWRLSAQKLTLNRDTGRGVATNGVLSVKGVPILYSPYFSFPLDNRRQTGFLFPTFEHSTRSGYQFGIPFYWNIAPNYDATITPVYMSLRGLQLNGIFRYLTSSGDGNIHGSFIPDDRAFNSFKNDKANDYNVDGSNPGLPKPPPGFDSLESSSNDRYFVSFLNNERYSDKWSSHVYLNHVSDDYYFEDFSSDPAQTTDNQLINIAALNYHDTHWKFNTQLIDYQTLHPINQGAVDNQYKKLPEINLDGNYPSFLGNLSFNIADQYDNFKIDKNPWQTQNRTYGQRLYTDPEISFPKYWLWGFFKPDIQVTGTQYDLSNQPIMVTGKNNMPVNSGKTKNQTIDRVLPIYDIDTGLYFERNFGFEGGNYKQTLEPRLFYLYVPYRNQSDIPLFDTTIDPFNYAQLFETNRYDGIDRIGDTNQLSAGLSTRFLNEQTGDEILRASIGQIYYFEQRRVNLTLAQAGLVGFDNQVPPNAMASPIAGELEYHITKRWLTLGDVAWEPDGNTVNNTDLALQYHRDDDHILNLGYHFLRGGDALVNTKDNQIKITNSNGQNLNQTDFSLVWPITQEWKFIGRWNYNISHNYPQTYYGGVEYEACCWAFRVVGAQNFNYLSPSNHPVFNREIYLQVALKTLGSGGTNDPSTMFMRDIPGYVDHFGKPAPLTQNANI